MSPAIIFRGISSILILHLHLSCIYLSTSGIWKHLLCHIALQGALCNDTDEDDLIPPSWHKNNSFQIQTPSSPNLCLCVTLYLAFGPFNRIQQDLKSLCRVAVGSFILDTLRRIPKAHSAIHCTRDMNIIILCYCKRHSSLLLSVAVITLGQTSPW